MLDSNVIELIKIKIRMSVVDIDRRKTMAKLNYRLGKITFFSMVFIIIKTSLLLTIPTIKIYFISLWYNFLTSIMSISTSLGIPTTIIGSAIGVAAVTGTGATLLYENNDNYSEIPEFPTSETFKESKKVEEHIIIKNKDKQIESITPQIKKPIKHSVTIYTISGEEYTGIIYNQNEDVIFILSNNRYIEINNNEILSININQ